MSNGDFIMETMITYSVKNTLCPVASALSAIEGKWKLPILWVLSQKEVMRYNELKKSIEGITNMMLSSSLKELDERGIVKRVQYNEIPPRVEYSLTDVGKKLLPVLNELASWGETLLDKAYSKK
jgi:DNA-binding HxlR family transcriptional regulator